MKIYICRDVSCESSRYIVYSDTQQEIFRISGKSKSGFERMYINNGQERVAKISDTSISVIRSYYISSSCGNFHLVIKNTKDNMMISYRGLPFCIRGSVIAKSYDILDADKTLVACVQKRFNTSSETLELNIKNDNYLIHCIASAVCLNNLCTTDALALQTT